MNPTEGKLTEAETLKFVERCAGMPGAIDIMTAQVTAEDYRNYLKKNEDTFFANGRLAELCAKDMAAGMVKLSARFKNGHA